MKNKRLILALILIFAIAAVGISLGATAAYWTEASSLTGFAPQANTYDFTAWAKYVEWEIISSGWTFNSESGLWTYASGSPDFNVAITGFKNYLAEDVVLPKYITANVSVGGSVSSRTLVVTEIRNTMFNDVSLKTMPTSLVVPPDVTVEPLTFSGLTNLKEVVFAGFVSSTTTVERNAFMGCTSLNKVEFQMGNDTGGNAIHTSVRFYDDVFAGCINLTSISATTSPASITYGSSSSTTVTESNWAYFLSAVGAPSTVPNPYAE